MDRGYSFSLRLKKGVMEVVLLAILMGCFFGTSSSKTCDPGIMSSESNLSLTLGETQTFDQCVVPSTWLINSSEGTQFLVQHLTRWKELRVRIRDETSSRSVKLNPGQAFLSSGSLIHLCLTCPPRTTTTNISLNVTAIRVEGMFDTNNDQCSTSYAGKWTTKGYKDIKDDLDDGMTTFTCKQTITSNPGDVLFLNITSSRDRRLCAGTNSTERTVVCKSNITYTYLRNVTVACSYIPGSSIYKITFNIAGHARFDVCSLTAYVISMAADTKRRSGGRSGALVLVVVVLVIISFVVLVVFGVMWYRRRSRVKTKSPLVGIVEKETSSHIYPSNELDDVDAQVYADVPDPGTAPQYPQVPGTRNVMEEGRNSDQMDTDPNRGLPEGGAQIINAQRGVSAATPLSNGDGLLSVTSGDGQKASGTAENQQGPIYNVKIYSERDEQQFNDLDCRNEQAGYYENSMQVGVLTML